MGIEMRKVRRLTHVSGSELSINPGCWRRYTAHIKAIRYSIEIGKQTLTQTCV